MPGLYVYLQKGGILLPELKTFSKILEEETQEWINREIRDDNKAWSEQCPADDLSHIHWNMVADSAVQLSEHLAGSGQNMTPGIFVCRCIQSHRPELLKKSDGTTAKTSDLVHCKPEDLKPWPTSTLKIVAANLESLCLAELGCENPGTAWLSILKRDVSCRRMGNRQEAYHIAFLLKMTLAEMQRYFFLTRQESFNLRDSLDVVCYIFKIFDQDKTHADSFRWQDVTELLQGYLDACKKADAKAASSDQDSSKREDSTVNMNSDAQKLYAAMHSANDPAIDIPALKKDLKAYLVTHRHGLVEMKLDRIHPKKLPLDQSRIEISMGYPYSNTVRTELSVLVGYLLVLYGCWNKVVKRVYTEEESSRRDELLFSEGAKLKLLSIDDFVEVLGRAKHRESLSSLATAFQAKLDAGAPKKSSEIVFSPSEMADFIGRWLQRVIPKGAESPGNFKAAEQFLNDFLLCAKAIDPSISPASTYPASARNASAVIWVYAGRLHCKNALSALIGLGPKSKAPNAFDWTHYLYDLGAALCKVSRDPKNFNDREQRGMLSSDQRRMLVSSVFCFSSTYGLYPNSDFSKRCNQIRSHLEKGLPNLTYKIEATLGGYYPHSEAYALLGEEPVKKELDHWKKNIKLASKLLSREDLLQLFFFLILAMYDCSTTERTSPECGWLNAMIRRAEDELKGPNHTTGSFLEDAIASTVDSELTYHIDEPGEGELTPDRSTVIRRIYNFLLDSLTAASGTTWHHIYYPAFIDRFYVLAGALATAVPQSRQTLGFMMGAHYQKKAKPDDQQEDF